MFYGNTTEQFSENTLFIIGKNIPHVFIGENKVLIESLSIYFNSDWLYNIYPKSNLIEHFLRLTHVGLKIEKIGFSAIIETILNKNGIEKIIQFLSLVEKISASEHKNTLSDFQPILEKKQLDSSRINTIYKFISDNFNKEIKLDEIADLANMTPPSFCRYFKQRTDKTLSQFVMEMRVDYASKQLFETDNTVSRISQEAGYNNFSNFLRQFKKIKGQTPKKYRNYLNVK